MQAVQFAIQLPTERIEPAKSCSLARFSPDRAGLSCTRHLRGSSLPAHFFLSSALPCIIRNIGKHKATFAIRRLRATPTMYFHRKNAPRRFRLNYRLNAVEICHSFLEISVYIIRMFSSTSLSLVKKLSTLSSASSVSTICFFVTTWCAISCRRSTILSSVSRSSTVTSSSTVSY